MAELNGSNTGWSAAQTRAQYAAVARLRWRMFVNGFRRKGSAGDLVALIVTVPLFLLLVGGIAVAFGFGAAYFADTGQIARVSVLLWGAFVVCQLANINLGQPGTTFDPTQLIRFPLTLRSFVALRLFFGLLAPGNVAVVIFSLAIAVGVIAVRPALWVYALVAMAVFAAVNVLFTRMVFAWVDRWLSTRRAREVFMGLVFVFSMGAQWANVSLNPAYQMDGHRHHARGAHHADAARVEKAMAFYAKARPLLAMLPPELTGNSLGGAEAGRHAVFVAETAGCALYGLLFLGVFALRMRTEFRGENLSDPANAVRVKKKSVAAAVRDVSVSRTAVSSLDAGVAAPTMSATVRANFAKEFVYLRRNMGLFYGLVAPLVMVLFFAGKFATRGNATYVFPAAMGYALLGVVPVSFNSFGLDGLGAQLYFLAPSRLRDVLLAKNLLSVMLAFAEVLAVLAMVSYVSAAPTPLLFVSSLLWTLTTLLVELTVGNYRSLSAPKRIDPGKAAQKQARPLNALLSMAILLGSGGVAVLLYFAANELKMPFLLPTTLAVLAVGAGALYWNRLGSMDEFALAHRETLFAELSKKS